MGEWKSYNLSKLKEKWQWTLSESHVRNEKYFLQTHGKQIYSKSKQIYSKSISGSILKENHIHFTCAFPKIRINDSIRYCKFSQIYSLHNYNKAKIRISIKWGNLTQNILADIWESSWILLEKSFFSSSLKMGQGSWWILTAVYLVCFTNT